MQLFLYHYSTGEGGVERGWSDDCWSWLEHLGDLGQLVELILDNFTPDLSSCKSRDPPQTLEFSIRLVSRSFYVSNSTSSAKRV